MNNITIIKLLALLDKAGDEGMTAPEMARQFDFPPRQQTRNSRVNTTLGHMAGRQFVRRAGQSEPSRVYNNLPTWRWFILDAGRAYLADGGKKGRAAARIAAAEQHARDRDAKRERCRELIFDVSLEVVRARLRHKCDRDAEIRHLYAEGCILDDIGALFNITRERVRQIVAGLKTSGCSVPGHDYPVTPCTHGVVHRPDPGARRWPLRSRRQPGRTPRAPQDAPQRRPERVRRQPDHAMQ